MGDRVSTVIDGGVARVTLTRADKRNGLDLAMFEALVAAGESIAGDPAVRAVVLAGEGQAFCAGLDFKWFMSNPAEARRLLERVEGSDANVAQRAAWIWQEVPVPVIAAVHGATFGGGLQIALGADLRLVAPEARLSVMEIEWGLVPDMSLTQTLLRLMPIDRAKELVWSGRILSGVEAVEAGLATRLSDDPRGDALELARAIAGRSPDAIRAAKQLLDRAPQLPRAEALALETELQLGLLGSPNQLEAVQARLAGRPPTFRDPS